MLGRQSIDMLGSVHSPSIGLLGTPSLARFGSSFLSSSLTRRFTPEAFSSSISKPLLPTVIDDPHKHAPPHSPLGPSLPSRRSSISVRRDDKDKPVVIDSHGLPISRHSTFGQAVVNGNITKFVLLLYYTLTKFLSNFSSFGSNKFKFISHYYWFI